MQKFGRRWKLIDKINFLQRKIIINSFLYYERDTNILTDAEYNELAHQLAELMKEVDINKTRYGYAYGNDFDGSTGFYLYDALTAEDAEEIEHLADLTLKHHNKNNKKLKRRKLF